ncbi:helix-turn-helix transcriptional regulator [Paracoccus spongiarum]|uniref:Helix-turn-helix transcriptional regulator n=1 Tax=Paracoccus spongiarum TaxID=3064387 RepID=A0ABT9JE81_9RHOB|nr:helix-turn-helix transcriptional regulator [Paracoccus sp. 2205BS29-5]MDP5308140.1 helix-turn-helix transcriptional regulator [Paracoccus sp. 2205BS29-5]
MRLTPLIGHLRRQRAAMLSVVIVLQAICATFFLIDVIEDFLEPDDGRLHVELEVLAVLGLCAGVVILLYELRDMLARIDSMDRGIRAARGDMSDLIEAFFAAWALTPSEREVATLVLKGFDNEAIAGLRGVAVGTVRAQTARIYAKAGIDGRAQLFSVFMEELLADPADRSPAPGDDGSRRSAP